MGKRLEEKALVEELLAGDMRRFDELYALYRELHDAFGGVEGAKGDLASFMKRLLVIRERQSGK